MTTKFVLQSFTDKVLKGIDRQEFISRRKAALHLARRMRKNISKSTISAPGDFPGKYSGNLRRGVGYKITKSREVIFGVKAPHAHLLEDGHDYGTVTKAESKRPFFKKTFEQEKGILIDILSEKWL